MQAIPSKVGNRKSLAQGNEGLGDENTGAANSSSLNTHNERRNIQQKSLHIPNPKKAAFPPKCKICAFEDASLLPST